VLPWVFKESVSTEGKKQRKRSGKKERERRRERKKWWVISWCAWTVSSPLLALTPLAPAKPALWRRRLSRRIRAGIALRRSGIAGRARIRREGRW
jgi:hypothetical protein